MAWMAVVVLNGLIAVCYLLIAYCIAQGLVRTKQVRSNPLALATAAIFISCAMHHAHHALHLIAFSSPEELAIVRETYGEWHSVLIDAFGAAIAVTYLGLRRTYKALLNTPAMFDDAVRIQAEKHWKERALTDQLTGIPNRAAYQHRADELVADEGVDDVALLFIDLDGFKQINDTYGHDAGDRLLVGVAERLEKGMHADEQVYRLGGDEFVVLRSGDVGDVALAAAVRRVHDAVSAPFSVRGGDVVVGASIGVAIGPSAVGVECLLREADASMYRIKAKNTVPPPRQARDAAVPYPV